MRKHLAHLHNSDFKKKKSFSFSLYNRNSWCSLLAHSARRLSQDPPPSSQHSTPICHYPSYMVNGNPSEWMPVLSGAPQGIVLGPHLFLMFVNDIYENVTSTTRLFADDCTTPSSLLVMSSNCRRTWIRWLIGLKLGGWNSICRNVRPWGSCVGENLILPTTLWWELD